MTEKELQDYLTTNFEKNEKCEWKEFKSLRSAVSGNQVTMLFLMFLQLQTCKAVI
jgi:hypothetical protein